MKIFIKGLTISTVLVLAACSNDSSSDNKGSDSKGNCTVETVSAYNDINHKARMFDLNKDMGYATGVTNACAKFSSLIGGGSCKAENLVTGSTMSVSYSDVKSVCDKANGILNPKPAAPVKPELIVDQPKPITPVDSRTIAKLSNGVSFKVKDANLINKLIKAAASEFIQAGQIIPSVTSVDKTKNLCFLKSEDASFEVRDGDVIKMTDSESKGRNLSIVSSDIKLQLGCLKMNSDSEWTLQELKDVFHTSADVSAAE